MVILLVLFLLSQSVRNFLLQSHPANPLTTISEADT